MKVIFIYLLLELKIIIMNTRKNKKLFWKLQISGWILLFFIYLLLYYRTKFDNSDVLIGLSVTYFSGFFVTLLLRKVYQFTNYKTRSIKSISIIIIIGTVITANVWFWLDTALSHLALGNVQALATLNFNRYLSWIWSNSFVVFLWSALYFSIKLWDEWLSEKLRAEKANSLAHKAQLQMLRYQLNPHFLFNSLNSIRALIEEDKSRAKSMITELSEFLRYSLLNKNLSDVPLRNELEAMKHYFSIEKTRFEEKLEVTFQVDLETENLIVPSFLIHPLIENAIKYGMKTTSLPLKILIKASLEINNLCIEVCNSGNWIESKQDNNSTGTGLENVKQRLENAYPNNHSFEIVKNSNSVCVKITIMNIEGNHE